MAEQEPLKIKKDTLIKKIEETQAKARTEWEADHAKELASEAEAIAMVRAVAEENPLALVEMVEAKVYLSEFRNPAKFVEWVAKMHPRAKLEYTPDAGAEKLLSVLKAADNTTIDVYPTDNYYRYL